MKQRKLARPRPLSRRREMLVESNLRLVQIIARNIGGRVPACFDLDDLAGPGNLGLVQAARRFCFRAPAGDCRSIQTRFKAYARRVIEGRIIDAVRRNNWTYANAPHLEDMPTEAGMFRDERQHPEDLAHINELRAEMRRTMARALDPRKQRILTILYELDTPNRRRDMTVRETALRVGLSASHTGLLAREAIAELRSRLPVAA